MKPRQKKSRFYYYFWGICAVAVCAGQWYVGSGYRRMSNSIDNILSAPIVIDLGRGACDPPLQFLIDDNMAREVPST